MTNLRSLLYEARDMVCTGDVINGVFHWVCDDCDRSAPKIEDVKHAPRCIASRIDAALSSGDETPRDVYSQEYADQMRKALCQIVTGAIEPHDGFTYSEIAEIASKAMLPPSFPLKTPARCPNDVPRRALHTPGGPRRKAPRARSATRHKDP
jgi:hypothetical protein